MAKVTVAAIQMSCSAKKEENIEKADSFVRQAAAKGAQIILLPELFETLYFCQVEDFSFYKYAAELEESKTIKHFQKLACELSVILPISFFEKKNRAYYNSAAIISSDGSILGVYRKTHLPTGPGYEEKFYFNPGDTGFKVWKTKFGSIGIGICWDQWFPESTRCLSLKGAELIFYPTSIGSEPDEPEVNSKEHWQRCIQGQAAANIVPIIVANRVGKESIKGSSVTFYGSSFIAGPTGEILAEAGEKEEEIISAEFDLDVIEDFRISWTVFRDRRPEAYKALLSFDGEEK